MTAAVDKEEIRRLVDCRTLAEHLGVKFSRTGGDRWKAHCFHPNNHSNGDRNPSLSVDATGFKCWSGSCGVEGDCFALVMEVEGVSFTGALEWLAGFVGRTPQAERPKATRRGVQPHVSTPEPDPPDLSDVREIWEKVWSLCELGPKGVEYIESRGFPTELAEHVGIRSVENKAEWGRIRRECGKDALELAGLRPENDRGRYPLPWRTPFLVIPMWLDVGVDIIRFRDLSGSAPKYLSPHKFNPAAPYLAHGVEGDTGTLFVCEGELNALSVVAAGQCAVGSCGSGGWQDGWSNVFEHADRVVILEDGDDAGAAFKARVCKDAAAQHGEEWAAYNIESARFSGKPKTDANDALKAGVLAELLEQYV